MFSNDINFVAVLVMEVYLNFWFICPFSCKRFCTFIMLLIFITMDFRHKPYIYLCAVIIF